MNPRRLAMAMLAALALLFVTGVSSQLLGCGTSPAFREGVNRAIPAMEPDLRYYAASQPVRVADVNQLVDVAKDKDAITVDRVAAPWSAIKVWYVPAFEADATLGADVKVLMRDNVGRFDRLIKEERARPLSGK